MIPYRYHVIIFIFNLTPAYLASPKCTMDPVRRSYHGKTEIARSYDTAKPNFQKLANTDNDVAYLSRILLTIELAGTFATRTFPSTPVLNIEARTLQLIATPRGDPCPFHFPNFNNRPISD